jgi:hypothetical protein
MKQRIGFLVICMAMMTADSNSLIVPAILAAVGAALILAGKRGDNECQEK